MSGKSFPSSLIISLFKLILAVPENKSTELGELKKILVIRQHNQFGDMLAGVSLFRALKEKYPESQVTLIASPDNYYGVTKNKFIDRLIVFDKRKIFNPEYFSTFSKILREGFDAVIVPVTVSVSFTSNLIARLSNSKIRIGPKSLDGVINESSFVYDRRVDIDWRKYPDSNVAEHILEVVKPFGISTDDFSSEISLDETDITFAKDFLSEINYDKKSYLIGLHIGAGKPQNRWSLQKYIELIEKLNSNYNCVFYLTGSDSDKNELDFVTSNTKVQLHKFLNKEIPQVAALISLLYLFITNDTGIMHVAGTTGTPQISLFGSTNPFNWAPCGTNKLFIRKSDLIDDIEVDDVYNLCKKLLGSKL